MANYRPEEYTTSEEIHSHLKELSEGGERLYLTIDNGRREYFSSFIDLVALKKIKLIAIDLLVPEIANMLVKDSFRLNVFFIRDEKVFTFECQYFDSDERRILLTIPL